jgi:ketol-acid reductoisomerase
MTMYYSEVDGAEPTVSTQVGGIKYTFTNESLTKLIEEKESLKVGLAAVERTLKSAQFDVREHFQARYDTEQLEILSEVTDVNELLVSIGSEALTKAWSATVTITATVTGIEAPTAEAAKKLVADNIELNLTTDGDIWVDDVTVESTYPEA